MPYSPLTCRKCRVGACAEGDTWCVLCSCLQTLGELSRQRLHVPSFRALAEELVKQTTRQYQAILGLDRQTQSQFTSLTDRLNNAQRRLNESTGGPSGAYPKSAPRRRSQSAVEPAAKEELQEEREVSGRERREERREEPREDRREDRREERREERQEDREEGRDRREDKREAAEADYGSESESDSEEEETAPPAEGDKGREGHEAEEESREVRRGSERPPEPLEPPRAPPPPKKKKRRRSRSRHRGRRGGSRHQAQYRGLYNPGQEFHHRTALEPLDLGREYGRSRGNWRWGSSLKERAVGKRPSPLYRQEDGRQSPFRMGAM